MSDPRDTTIAALAAALMLAKEALESFDAYSHPDFWLAAGAEFKSELLEYRFIEACRRAREAIAAIDKVNSPEENT